MKSPTQILLVDDDSSTRQMYSDFLAADGCDVVVVSSAIDALEHLYKGEKFDLVVTDIMMAKMDGWELLSTIRNELGYTDTQLPVIVMSAFSSANIETKAFHLGANAYYLKGEEPIAKLMQTVRILTGRVRSKFDATSPSNS